MLGMLSILSIFISKPWVVTLNKNIIIFRMTKCVFIDYLVRRLRQLNKGMYKKVTYIRMCKFMIQKRKSLFIPIKAQLITISSVISYILEINSISNSLKKKKKKKKGLKREKGKREERKRECERKGKRDGKEKEEEKGKEEKRLKKKEKEKKEEKEKEEEKIEKVIQKMYRPLRTHSLARS